MGKVAKGKWVTFAGENLHGKSWDSTVEIVHDGWLVHLKNNSSLAVSFLLIYGQLFMPPQLAEGGRLSISYLSDSLANPGEEVLLHLSFNFADGSLLRQDTLIKLKYGIGMGEYSKAIELTLPVVGS